MPIYEYRCQDCGTIFEKMARFSDSEKNPECPDCESDNTQKLVSSFAANSGFNFSPSTSTSNSCNSSGHFT